MSSSDLHHFMINDVTASKMLHSNLFQSEASKKIVDAPEGGVVTCKDIDDVASFSFVSLINNKTYQKNAIWGGGYTLSVVEVDEN